MARKSKRNKTRRTPREPTATPTAPATTRRFDRAVVVVGIAGMLVTGILLGAMMRRSGLPYCGAGSGCNLVQGSAWSMFLGVPLALWGFGAYLAITLIGCMRRRDQRARWLVFAGTGGFLLSAYLTAISAWSIGAFCVYCLLSAALMTVVFGLGFRRVGDVQVARARIAAVAFAALIAGVMHAGASGWLGGTDAVDPELRALAEHLTARGITFYGASWCPHCQQQKEVFGGAAKFLPYVECSPHGPRGPQATVCISKEIKNYPTWVVDGRKIERLMPAETLAKISGFKGGGTTAR